ncbi:MAG: flagellar hook-length control protein FliK [Candidatus Thermoplasmatota archaeon]|nr:flagellar hook-length control protein FliK [Candidatus Thermoplasmatota archaeon]
MFPVQYLARVLDVPPTPDTAGRPLSGLVGVQPVLNATERDQAAPRAAFEHLALGQALTGQVKSLSKGIALVEIEGQTVAMRLPRETAPGDTLRLRFAGHVPQPVFLLVPPEAAAGDAPQLSQTARMLSDLMQRMPERSALPTLTPPGPLLDQPTTNPAMLAIALRTALVRSGLFYESHLANWAVGEDSLDGLMQEPQNRPALPGTAETAGPKPLNPMHALLSQQLQVLESPQFVWRGEVWPGQLLEWQLRHEAGAARDQPATEADEANAGWESHLKLSLPQLGTLNVHIRLDARLAFSIRMTPEQSGTGPLLQQHQGRLIEQLAAAGCTLKTLTVERDASA